ncbi:MAG: hypothetical protein GON13_00070 [Nanoarchaeota archaeon]|nr:hypothetical protein [Nanoarchaeota archaeon]
MSCVVMFNFLKESCEKALSNTYTLQGYVVAGTSIFYDLWTRDFCYASQGILSHNPKIARNCFKLLLKNQAITGEFPNLLTQAPNNKLGLLLSFKLWDVRKKDLFKLQPWYQHYNGNTVLDATLLFIIYYSKFLGKSVRNYSKILKAGKWVQSQDLNGNGLLDEKSFAGWEDSINKTQGKLGNSSYHNILAIIAYNSIINLAKIKGDVKTFNEYSKLSEELRKRVFEVFWHDNGYFKDFVGKGDDVLNASANLLAIRFGIVNKNDAKKILVNVENFRMNVPFGLKVRNKKLPFYRINFLNNLLGTSDYHNTAVWSWLGALYVMCLIKVGWKNKARDELLKIQSVIEKHGLIEVYDAEGNPLKGYFSFHSSEKDFAWSAGMLLETINSLKKIKKLKKIFIRKSR